METKYLPLSDIINYMQTNELPQNDSDHSWIGVCSIADLMLACEEYKKNIVGDYQTSRFFQDTPEANFGEDSDITVAGLDRERLLETLFESDGTLWQEATSSISPLHSLRKLSMRVSDTVWWDYDTYREMEEVSAE